MPPGRNAWRAALLCLAGLSACAGPEAGFEPAAGDPGLSFPEAGGGGLAESERRLAELAAFRAAFLEAACGLEAARRADFEARIARLQQDAARLSPDGYRLRLQHAVAAAGEARTRLRLDLAFPERLPLRLGWFAEGLFVTAAAPDQTELLGARAVAIGGLGVGTLQERLAGNLGGPAAQARALAGDLLARPGLLRALGAKGGDAPPGDGGGPMPFALVLADGAAALRALPALPAGAGEEDWPAVLDRLPEPPAWLSPPEDGVGLAWIEEIDAALLRIAGAGMSDLADRLTAILETLEARAPRHVIVDLRLLEDGPLEALAPFAHALGERAALDGRLAILTSRRTGGGGIAVAAILKYRAGARALVAGAPLGDRLRFRDGGEELALSQGLRVRVARAYHDWRHGVRPKDPRYACDTEKGALDLKYSAAAGDLEPDLPVDPSFADYAAGRDPVLDAVVRVLAPSG